MYCSTELTVCDDTGVAISTESRTGNHDNFQRRIAAIYNASKLHQHRKYVPLYIYIYIYIYEVILLELRR